MSDEPEDAIDWINYQEPEEKPLTLRERFNWPVIVCLMIIWFSLLGVIVWRGDELANNPCEFCAKVMKEPVTISKTGILNDTVVTFTRTYYPNGTIVNRKGFDLINYSGFEEQERIVVQE